MPNNAPHNALRAAVARAMANGAPVFECEPDPAQLDTFLSHAVTRWDRLQAAKASRTPRAYYNPNALGIYLGRVEETIALVQRGTGIEEALRSGFNDRLLDFLLRAVATGQLPAVKD
jgi:hypothetical protein